MKHKQNLFTKTVVMIVTLLCIMSLCVSIVASAASPVDSTLSNGYTVRLTASYSGKSSNGVASVINGGCATIRVYTYAYRLSGTTPIYVGYGTSLESYHVTASAGFTGNYTLCGAKTTATFNGESVTPATKGNCG